MAYTQEDVARKRAEIDELRRQREALKDATAAAQAERQAGVEYEQLEAEAARLRTEIAYERSVAEASGIPVTAPVAPPLPPTEAAPAETGSTETVNVEESPVEAKNTKGAAKGTAGEEK